MRGPAGHALQRAVLAALVGALLPGCPASGAYSYSVSGVRIGPRWLWVVVTESRPTVVPEVSKSRGLYTSRSSRSLDHLLRVDPWRGTCREESAPERRLPGPVTGWYRKRDPRLYRLPLAYAPPSVGDAVRAVYSIGDYRLGGGLLVHLRTGSGHEVRLVDRHSGQALAAVRLAEPPELTAVGALSVLVKTAHSLHLIGVGGQGGGAATVAPQAGRAQRVRTIQCGPDLDLAQVQVRFRRGLPIALLQSKRGGGLALLHLGTGACLTRAGFPALPGIVAWYRAGGGLLGVDSRVGVVVIWRVGPRLHPVRLAHLRVETLPRATVRPSGDARVTMWRIDPSGSFWATIRSPGRHVLVRVDAATGRQRRVVLSLLEDSRRDRFRPLCRR